MIALDASALLAYLFHEPGWELVRGYLPSSLLSSVNLSEVLARFARDGHDPVRVLRELLASPLRVVDFSAQHATLAAAMSPKTLPLGLSLGDRACLALALAEGIPALTADRLWTQARVGVDVVLVRGE